MWYAIIFILHLTSGYQTFYVHQLPLNTEMDCKVMLSHMKVEFNGPNTEYVSKGGCVFIPDSDPA